MAYSKGNTFSRVSEWKIKEQMCEIGHRIWLKGFCAGNEGNHSYRISENRILCTPTGISKGHLKPDDICTVDLDGKQVAGSRKRTSEILLHLEIYKARPEIKAVVHSHPPHATAFAIAGVDLPSCIHPEAEVFLGVVKMAKYVTPGDKRLGESILPYVKDGNTILLANHGTVTFDTELETAYYKLEILDSYARLLLLAKEVGSIRQLSGQEMKELLDLKARFGLKDWRHEAGADKLTCSSDFLTRVGGDVATKGRMVCGDGTMPVPERSQTTAIEEAIATLAPGTYDESQIEELVQTITDQIMAAAN